MTLSRTLTSIGTLTLALAAGCSSTRANQAAGSGAGGGDAGTGGAAPLPCGASGVSKGPWSFGLDGTSAKLRWEACRQGVTGTVTYAPEAGGAPLTAEAVESSFTTLNTYTAILDPSVPPDLAGTWYMHDVALTGLTPATCYTYQLAADPSTLEGRFCTARAPGDPLTFMSIGDTNPGIGPYAAGDLQYSLPKNPDFTLHGGDIQYYSSGLETWASWFPVMEPMLAQGGFFPAIGNHEAEEPDEYVAYTERYFGTPGFDGSEYYRFQSAGVWFFSLDTEEALDPGSAQGGWLIKELADATTQPGFRFSIVYFHRPLVTCGDTGDNPELRALLEPFFLQYHVPIVIQAHMHGYERFEFGNITYLTIAGGGGIIGNPDLNVSRSYCNMRVASGGVRHAAIFEVGTGTVHGTITDWQGNVFDSFTETVP